MVSHYFSQSQESKHGSSIFKERDLGDQYLTQRLLKDLLADPPPPPEAAAVFDTAADFCNAASQDPSVVSRSRPNAGTLMPVSKQRRTSVRMPTGNIATAPLELSGTASKKPRKAQLGKPEHVIRMTSRKSIMSAKSQQPVFSSTLEPSSSSAISDARFGAAPDVFGDSYAPSLTTIVALPDARRGFGRCSSDGESVTSPLAREEPPGVFGNARQKGTTVAKSETGQSGLTRKGVRGTKSETKVKEENRAIGLCGKGSRKVKAGSEIRRRSSSGSTGPEVSSAEKTAATSSPVTKNEKTADQKGEKKKPYPRTERVSNGTEVSDAVSVASCQPEGLKWAKGSAESMVTGLTRKVHELEAELSRSRSAVLRLESDLLESRACEAEVRLLLSEQTGQLAGLQEKVNQADGLVEEVRKRETELVEMAGFVRGLQERVKGLEQENVALRRRGSKSARAEKGEGTQGLVEEAENVSAVTENGIEDETGFATANKAGFAGDSETAVLAANEDGFGTRFNCKVADGVDGNGDPPGQSSAESEKVDSPEAERLRQEVTRLTEQLDEMKAFLADYGLTWVGEMGTSHVVSSSGQSFPGSDSSDKRPGSATGEGHWEPSRSWAPVMGQKRNAAAVKGESAPTKTPSVSVPSWLAAHLEEQNGTGKAPSSDANVHSTSSPKLSSLSASLKHPTGTLPSPTSAKHETVRPAKLDVLCSSQRTPSSPEEGPSDSVRMCISSRGKRNETVDVRALREAIDGLNALASEGGATVVTSPGGREHRLQEPTSIPLTVYANGIQLGSGTEFRPASSPAARSLLADILDGFFPYELKAAHPDGVPLRLVDRSAERFTLPFQPFRGEKRVLVSRESGMERNESNGTEGGRKGGVEGGEGDPAGEIGHGVSASIAERESGTRMTSVSQGGASMKSTVDEPPNASGDLTSRKETRASRAEPHPVLASTSEGLFRADTFVEGGQIQQQSAPLTREEFLDRLPKKVIRGGKLIDVRGEIAQLLRPSGSAREHGRESASGTRGRSGKSIPTGSVDSSPASASGDVSVREGIKGVPSGGVMGNESSALQPGSDQKAMPAAVRLKVRGLEGLAWVVELPVGATVGQLYETVEKLRRKSEAVSKQRGQPSAFTLSTTFPTAALLDRTATLSELGLQQDTVLVVKERSPLK